MEKRPFTLSRSSRICKKTHFNHVFSNSRKRENAVAIVYTATAYFDEGYQAFVAGKRVGNAVARNRCKRRLKEIFRLNRHKISPLRDIILVAKPSLLLVTFKEAQSQIIDLFRGLGAIVSEECVS